MQRGEIMTLRFIEERRVSGLWASDTSTETMVMDVLVAERWNREVVLVDPDLLAQVMRELSELRQSVAMTGLFTFRDGEESES